MGGASDRENNRGGLWSPAAPASSAATSSIACWPTAMKWWSWTISPPAGRRTWRSTGATPRLTFHQVDVSEHEAIRPWFEGAEWVFHLAALADIVPSIQIPLAYHQANVDGTASVLEAARAGRREAAGLCGLVLVLRPARRRSPRRRRPPIRPMYPYALTKYVGEQYVMHWQKTYRLPCVSLRLFNVYGPRSRTSGTYGAVFGVFLAQKLAGQALHRGGRRHANPRLHLRHRRGGRLRQGGAVGRRRGSLQRRLGRHLQRQPPGGVLRGRGRAHSEAARRARLHLRRHGEDRPATRLAAHGEFRRWRDRRCCRRSTSGGTRRSGTPSRSPRRRAIGSLAWAMLADERRFFELLHNETGAARLGDGGIAVSAKTPVRAFTAEPQIPAASTKARVSPSTCPPLKAGGTRGVRPLGPSSTAAASEVPSTAPPRDRRS